MSAQLGELQLGETFKLARLGGGAMYVKLFRAARLGEGASYGRLFKISRLGGASRSMIKALAGQTMAWNYIG